MHVDIGIILVDEIIQLDVYPILDELRQKIFYFHRLSDAKRSTHLLLVALTKIRCCYLETGVGHSFLWPEELL